jgi:hypothetical protein
MSGNSKPGYGGFWCEKYCLDLQITSYKFSADLGHSCGLIWFAVFLAIISPFFHLIKLLALSGLMFDVAGVIRLFLDEEWDELLEHYKDETDAAYQKQ